MERHGNERTNEPSFRARLKQYTGVAVLHHNKLIVVRYDYMMLQHYQHFKHQEIL